MNVSKATPLSHNNELTDVRNKQSVLRASLNNMYVAENYYKGMQGDGEHILYERDGTISKQRQFDYKVHTLMKNQKHDRKNKSKKKNYNKNY